jgi:predicted Fe-Mo cluster-binding NifX family protein
MKIGVSSQSGSMAAEVDSRFGRCPYYVVVDSETRHFEAFSNPAATSTGGAGPQTVQAFKKHEVEVVLTGHVGSNAQQALDAAGIRVVTGVSGKVKDAVDAYLKGIS